MGGDPRKMNDLYVSTEDLKDLNSSIKDLLFTNSKPGSIFFKLEVAVMRLDPDWEIAFRLHYEHRVSLEDISRQTEKSSSDTKELVEAAALEIASCLQLDQDEPGTQLHRLFEIRRHLKKALEISEKLT